MRTEETIKLPQKKKTLFQKIFKTRPKYDEEGNLIYYKKKKILKSRVNRSVGGDILMVLFLLISGVVMAFPMIYAISNSFKPLHELWLFPPNLIVRNPTVNNYKDMFTILSNSTVPFTRYLFNTLFITIGATLLRVISSCMAAYPLSKAKFKGRRALSKLITMTLMFAAPAAALANYLIMAQLGWIDTWLCLLVPALGSSFSLHLIRGFVDQFPDSVLEAARIDGAGEFRIFWSILMPNLKPAWMTLIVFSVKDYWNQGATIYIYQEELKSLNYALGQISAEGVARAGVSMAIGVIMMIVPIITFLITQSNIIETMATSGMKD